MESLLGVLLFVHIMAGCVSLLTGIIATITKAINVSHKYHVWSGKGYVGGMTVIIITALLMSVIKVNIPLLFISIFAAYLTWAGLRYAKIRPKDDLSADKIIARIGSFIFVGMIGYALWWTITYGTDLIFVLVFGILGLIFSWEDGNLFKTGRVVGKERIIQHISRMLGAMIGTITAFTVTNVTTDPIYVGWLAPTVIITPIIFIWANKIKKGTTRKGM